MVQFARSRAAVVLGWRRLARRGAAIGSFVSGRAERCRPRRERYSRSHGSLEFAGERVQPLPGLGATWTTTATSICCWATPGPTGSTPTMATWTWLRPTSPSPTASTPAAPALSLSPPSGTRPRPITLTPLPGVIPMANISQCSSYYTRQLAKCQRSNCALRR